MEYMECYIKSAKYIIIDAQVAGFIDFNGWPREVVILEVKGLEKAFGTDCLLFDLDTEFSIVDMYRILDEKHLDYTEV